MNRLSVATVRVSPASVLRTVIASSRNSPATSATTVVVQTRMFGVRAISSMRYCDMLLESEGPRTSRITVRANLAK